MFTLGNTVSGGATIVGSMMSLGFGLFTTTMGGVNCFKEGLGSLPLGAGRGERSPPPPPPPICFGLAGPRYGAISGAISVLNASLAFIWTVLLEATVKSSRMAVPWMASDIMLERLSLPYRPQMSLTAMGLEVTSNGGNTGGCTTSFTL